MREQFRGLRFGKSLLGHLARRAEAAGTGWIEWLVLEWNAPVIDFYKSIGGRPLEDWLTYRRDRDAMKKLGAI